MKQTLGELLLDARKAKGLTLSDANHITSRPNNYRGLKRRRNEKGNTKWITGKSHTKATVGRSASVR